MRNIFRCQKNKDTLLPIQRDFPDVISITRTHSGKPSRAVHNNKSPEIYPKNITQRIVLIIEYQKITRISQDKFLIVIDSLQIAGQ